MSAKKKNLKSQCPGLLVCEIGEGTDFPECFSALAGSNECTPSRTRVGSVKVVL